MLKCTHTHTTGLPNCYTTRIRLRHHNVLHVCLQGTHEWNKPKTGKLLQYCCCRSPSYQRISSTTSHSLTQQGRPIGSFTSADQ